VSLVFADRVAESTTTTGTGTLTLAGAVTGYQSFAAVGNGNTCDACVFAVDGNGNPSGAWEVFTGTYTLSGTTLSRTTVLASSNSGSPVNFGAGTKNVILTGPAGYYIGRDQFSANTFPAAASSGGFAFKAIADASLTALATGLGTAATQSTGAFDASGAAASALVTANAYTDTVATGLVPTSRTVNGQALSSNVSITSVTGNAGTVTVGDAGGDTTTWVLLGTSQTGSLAPATDSGLTFNATTNALTATTFIGALTGNADTVTTNANLAGPITSVGNATSVAAQTGTGSTFVMQASPTLTTPNIGTPSAGVLTNCTGLPVAGGGTGVATLTAYAVICGGTTATGAVQSIASVGTSGQVLTSNGAGALPTFQAAAGGGITIGTTAITSGTSGRVLYDNGGVVGEYSITGTGNVVMSASPTLTGTLTGAAANFSSFVTTPASTSGGFYFGTSGNYGIYRDGSGDIVIYDLTKAVKPGANDSQTLGLTGTRWSNVYSVLGNFSGTLTTAAITASGLITANGWIVDPGALRVTADVTNATATMTNLTDLTATLIAGRKYIGQLVIFASDSVAVDGLAIDFDGGTVTATSFVAGIAGTPIGATTGTIYSTALATDLTITTATTGDIAYIITFEIVVNAAGTFRPRFSQVAHTTGTATVRLGSWMRINDCPV
jgi:hypothetical protein